MPEASFAVSNRNKELDELKHFQNCGFKFWNFSFDMLQIKSQVPHLFFLNLSSKQVNEVSELFPFQSGLMGDGNAGNNKPSQKGNDSHPTRYLAWRQIWHWFITPTKWSWTDLVLTSTLFFLGGGIAGLWWKEIWPAKLSDGEQKKHFRKALKINGKQQ
jgi:hypothetical protein